MLNDRSTILLVDDIHAELSAGKNILRTYYSVIAVPSAAKMFEVLKKTIPNLILLDIEMPEMNGYEALELLKNDPGFKDIPVIFLTSTNNDASELRGFDLGAADYVSKPFSVPRLLRRIENQLLLARQKMELSNYADHLEATVKKKTNEVVHLQTAILATVADLVEFRDKLTGGHISRTQLYLKSLIAQMILEKIYAEETSKWDLDLFLPSAQLHDVGKIAIPDLILNKPGKLTPEEFDIMKTHVTAGVEAIETIMNEMKDANENAFLSHALLFAATHHEKWDGSGYPRGLKGKDIPLEGRLMAIADVYDALISVRAYKKAFTHEESCEIIINGSGTHFDPVLIDVFCRIEKELGRLQKK